MAIDNFSDPLILFNPSLIFKKSPKPSKTDSVFKSRIDIESMPPPLPKFRESEPGTFNFKDEVSEIKNNESIEDKDAELARRFYKIVNPKKIPDGHCASCAFNTYLHLNGFELHEAFEPNGTFKKFGDWFFAKVCKKFDDDVLESRDGETVGEFKTRLEQRIKETTKAGEAVLISLSEGTHWYNAYNDGTRVWFIDSQSGIGFNLYTGKDINYDEVLEFPESINIIKMNKEEISEYTNLFRGSA